MPKRSKSPQAQPPKAAPAATSEKSQSESAASTEDPVVRLNKARDAWESYHRRERKPQNAPLSHSQAAQEPFWAPPPPFMAPMPQAISPAFATPYPSAGTPSASSQSPQPGASEVPSPKFPWPTVLPQGGSPTQGPIFESLGKLMQMGMALATNAISGSLQMVQAMGVAQNGQQMPFHSGQEYSHGNYQCGCGNHDSDYRMDDCRRGDPRFGDGCSHVNGC